MTRDGEAPREPRDGLAGAERALPPWAWARAALITVAIVVALTADLTVPVDGAEAFRRQAIAPFRAWVIDPLELRQAWRLFARPHHRPRRLEIAVRRAGTDEWIVIHRQGDPTLDYDAWRIDYRRVRYFFNPRRRGGRDYRLVATWMASEIFRDMPDAAAVRLRHERLRVPEPGRAQEPSEWILEETRTRRQLELLEQRWAHRRGVSTSTAPASPARGSGS